MGEVDARILTVDERHRLEQSKKVLQVVNLDITSAIECIKNARQTRNTSIAITKLEEARHRVIDEIADIDVELFVGK